MVAARNVSTVSLVHVSAFELVIAQSQSLKNDALGDPIPSHGLVRLFEYFQSKLFAVCVGSNFVQQGVFGRMGSLGLLQLLHEVGRVGGTFFVSEVEAFGDNPLCDKEPNCILLALVHEYRSYRRTPVAYDGLELVQLLSADGKLGDVGAFQLRWYVGRHHEKLSG